MDAPNLYRELISKGYGMTEAYLSMGGILKSLKENDLWRKSVGEGGLDTWDDFLKQPEIGVSRLEAERMIKAHKMLVETQQRSMHDIIQIPIASIRKIVELEEITDEVIDNAILLSTKDFKESIAEQADIQERTYTYMVMRKCRETGNMTKVHGITNEEVKEKFNINE